MTGCDYNEVEAGDADLQERYVGPSKIKITDGAEHRSPKIEKVAKKTPENKIFDHLQTLEAYYDEIKLTDQEKIRRRQKHLDWVSEKLSKEFIEVDLGKEVIVKKIEGGMEGGPTSYHAINPGSGTRHRFVVPRDFESTDDAKVVVAKMAINYLNLWKKTSSEFKSKYRL